MGYARPGCRIITAGSILRRQWTFSTSARPNGRESRAPDRFMWRSPRPLRSNPQRGGPQADLQCVAASNRHRPHRRDEPSATTVDLFRRCDCPIRKLRLSLIRISLRGPAASSPYCDGHACRPESHHLRRSPGSRRRHPIEVLGRDQEFGGGISRPRRMLYIARSRAVVAQMAAGRHGGCATSSWWRSDQLASCSASASSLYESYGRSPSLRGGRSWHYQILALMAGRRSYGAPRFSANAFSIPVPRLGHGPSRWSANRLGKIHACSRVHHGFLPPVSARIVVDGKPLARGSRTWQ